MLNTNIKNKIDQLGNFMIETFHIIGLFIIGATIVWSAIHEYLLIMQHESGS
jgi:hypothetical protein